MKLGDRLDGHMVTGHVDGTGTVRRINREARSRRYVIEIPAALRRYVCRKGSICIDGVSLTINKVTGNTIAVNIIPHTLERTIIADYRAGTRVNLEVDIVARYLEGLTAPAGLGTAGKKDNKPRRTKRIRSSKKR
jgi:riboflavin synthase